MLLCTCAPGLCCSGKCSKNKGKVYVGYVFVVPFQFFAGKVYFEKNILPMTWCPLIDIVSTRRRLTLSPFHLTKLNWSYLFSLWRQRSRTVTGTHSISTWSYCYFLPPWERMQPSRVRVHKFDIWHDDSGQFSIIHTLASSSGLLWTSAYRFLTRVVQYGPKNVFFFFFSLNVSCAFYHNIDNWK